MNRKRKSEEMGLYQQKYCPNQALRNKDEMQQGCWTLWIPQDCTTGLHMYAFSSRKEKNDPEVIQEITIASIWVLKGALGFQQAELPLTQSPWGGPGRACSRGRPPPSGVMFPCLEPYVWPEGRALSQRENP